MSMQSVSLGGLTLNQFLGQMGDAPPPARVFGSPPARVQGSASALSLFNPDEIGLSPVAQPPAAPRVTLLDRLRDRWPMNLLPSRSTSRSQPTAAGRVSLQRYGQGYHLVGALPANARADRGEDRHAADAFRAMASAAARDGVVLRETSSYRSVAHQRRLYDRSDRSGRWVAAPGRSEHHTGLAFDIGTQGYSAGSRGNFDRSPAFRWLKENAYRFGFVQSMSWEAWHWRYDPQAVQFALGGQVRV